MTVRRLLFYLGWVLLLAAFAAAAAEVLVVINPGREWSLVSAHDLWYTVWPGNLVVTQIRIERVSPELWESVVRPLLNVPAWLLTGLPGAGFTWFFRPVRVLTPDEEQDIQERTDSMFLYDELAAQAKADGFDDGDDMAPDHGLHHLLEEDGVTVAGEEEAFDIDMNNLPLPPGGGDR